MSRKILLCATILLFYPATGGFAQNAASEGYAQLSKTASALMFPISEEQAKFGFIIEADGGLHKLSNDFKKSGIPEFETSFERHFLGYP